MNQSGEESAIQVVVPVTVAIVEGKGHAKGTIGMASMDKCSGVIEIRQFNDTPDYATLCRRIQILQDLNAAIEVLIPNAANEEKSQYIIRSKLGVQINPIERANFSETVGAECIKKLAQNYNEILKKVADKPFLLAALAALIGYVENNEQSNFGASALKISYKASEDSMLVDNDTVLALELLSSNRGKQKGLFALLNNTLTRGGTKLLRSLIREPPTSVDCIKKRQDAVSELKQKEDQLKQLREFLHLLQVDVDMVLSKIIQVPRIVTDTTERMEADIDLLVYLKHVLERMESLLEILSHLEGEAFADLFKKLSNSNYTTVLNLIQNVISQECVLTKGCVNFKTTKAFAVRKDLSQYLTVERTIYSEILQDLTDKLEDIRKRHQLDDKGCRIAYTVNRGFHLHISGKLFETQPIPIEFILIDNKAESIVCTTKEIMVINTRLMFKQKEIERISHVFILNLLADIRKIMAPVYTVSEVIAEVDFLASITIAAIRYDLVKPTFDDDETEITEGKHPILLTIMTSEKGEEGSEIPDVTSNSTHLTATTNFNLITGPNMAGKSVYIRQVGLLQILAQIGSHVPAKEAKFRICDKIFARIGSDDDIETNCSTFKRELEQVDAILRNVSDRSLVIIDELGRGTSDEEGVGLCFAVSEHLIKSKAFTLFATHFQDLHELSNMYYSVASFRFTRSKVIEGPNHIGYTHKLEERNNDGDLGDYGIDLAEASNFPPQLIQSTKALLARIKKGRPEVSAQNRAARRRLQFRVADHLKKLVIAHRCSPIPTLTEYLETFRTKAVMEVQKHSD